MNKELRLLMSCPDAPGLISAVSQFVYELGGNAIETNQFTDATTNQFYMRYVVNKESIPLNLQELRSAFRPIAEQYKMEWKVTDGERRPKVLILASKAAHCLRNLIYNAVSGDLVVDLPGVVSNHDANQQYVEFHNIPYHHIAVDPNNKKDHFKQIADLVDEIAPEVIVLARYMQILPGWFCKKYPNKIINIHHSFLPSFVGARPYHQAYERGVKVIGATCHYVTGDLDEGPIIQQDVVHISHHHSVEDIVRLGKDVESRVLLSGLRAHLEDRVISNGNKTVVFA